MTTLRRAFFVGVGFVEFRRSMEPQLFPLSVDVEEDPRVDLED